ncbi:hypothetical protein EMIT0215P_230042 [Pseudomonas serboccidentalis]
MRADSKPEQWDVSILGKRLSYKRNRTPVFYLSPVSPHTHAFNQDTLSETSRMRPSCEGNKSDVSCR